MTRVFLASRNAKKLTELRRILEKAVPDIEVLGLDDVTPYDEPAETEPTFEANALIKARSGYAATGLASHVPTDRRGAQFRCAVAFCADGVEEVSFGEMRGQVITELRGTGGFGYDVLFVPEGGRLTTAELDEDAKDAISHRGQALRAIAPVVARTLGR